MKNNILILLLFIFFVNISFAQNNIKTLEKQLKSSKGKNKITILYKLSKTYLSVSTKKSLKYGNEAYKLAKKGNYKYMQANALNMIGTAYFKQKKYNSAIKNYEKELEIRKSLGNKYSKLKTLYNIASVYDAKGRYNKSVDIIYKHLQTQKRLNIHL